MSVQNYSNKIFIKDKPEIIFNAITKEIDKWWTELSNEINQVGDQLIVSFEDKTSWQMDVVGFQQNYSTDWFVTHAYHDLDNLSKKDEWEKTIIKWKIEEKEFGSEVILVHIGLEPDLECYNLCSDGWDYFLLSLKKYVETGIGTPYKKS